MNVFGSHASLIVHLSSFSRSDPVLFTYQSRFNSDLSPFFLSLALGKEGGISGGATSVLLDLPLNIPFMVIPIVQFSSAPNQCRYGNRHFLLHIAAVVPAMGTQVFLGQADGFHQVVQPLELKCWHMTFTISLYLSESGSV